MNPNPYSWIVDSAKAPVFGVLFLFTVILSIALARIDRSLKTKEAPYGIFSFEMAGRRIHKIVASWSETARQHAFLSLGLDYLYLCIYPVTLSLACHLADAAGRGLWSSWTGMGLYLSWLVLAAIPLDALENYALLRVLNASANAAWPLAAKWCAIAKFGLILLGLVYSLPWLYWQITQSLL